MLLLLLILILEFITGVVMTEPKYYSTQNNLQKTYTKEPQPTYTKTTTLPIKYTMEHLNIHV